VTILTTPNQKKHSYSANVKAMTDRQLEQLNILVRKEIGDRYRKKHCEGMFEFDGKPMHKEQAIEAFISNRKERESSIKRALGNLPTDAQNYLKHMGDLYRHALRNKNEQGAHRMHDLMLKKLLEHNMADRADNIIEQLYS